MDGMTMDNDYDNDAKSESPLEQMEDEAEIVERAKECYRLGIDVSSQWREDAIKDLEFLAGEQWDPSIKGMRDAQGRPALTVNRLPQFVRQVTNEQRQSKPSVTVNPVDSDSDIQTAEVLQGLIRNVEYTSNADAAYASGGQSAAITGLGYWDIQAEYEDEKSFDQKLSIKRVANPLSVVMDPGAKELAGDDARWVVISTDISSGEWESCFPGKEMPKTGGWGGHGDSAAGWVAKDGVRIHEYRWIQDEEDTLIEVPAGMHQDPAVEVPGGHFEDMPQGGLARGSELDPAVFGALAQSGAPIHQAPPELADGGSALKSELDPKLFAALERMGAQTRPTTKRTARWAKIVGSEVVEQGKLAGKYLQLVRVVGTELEIDGQVIYEGVIRHARDTQRMLNYFVSAEAEAIALAPKAPFIAAEGQIENHEEEWRNANQRPLSVLQYRPMAIGGGMVPPPQRVFAEANIQSITNARMQAADDLKAVTGIYDAALGARSNEQSGRAILARQSQGQTANFHFQDNLAMAIRYTGRILIDLIPRIYSGPRVLRILGEDGKHEMVPVNGAQGEFRGEPSHDEGGEPKVQLDAGRYDVAVSMGPSYVSRRQEAAAQLLELIRVNPSISQVAGDLLVESMDIPGGKAIAERIRKTLPPEIRPPDDKQPPPQILAQQLQQAMQMNQQLTERLNQAMDRIESNAHDNETKERIEMSKLHVDLLKTAATLDSKEHEAMLTREAALIGKRLAMTGFTEPVETQQPQQPMMQQPPQGA